MNFIKIFYFIFLWCGWVFAKPAIEVRQNLIGEKIDDISRFYHRTKFGNFKRKLKHSERDIINMVKRKLRKQGQNRTVPEKMLRKYNTILANLPAQYY